jgi:hypothetical protein
VHVAPAAHLKTHPPPLHEPRHAASGGQSISHLPLGHVVTHGGVQVQPASGRTCAASHVGRGGASVVLTNGASLPPSGTTQLAMTSVSSSATVHCMSSAVPIAFSQVSFAVGSVQ